MPDSRDVLIAVAHGSKDPRAAATIEDLMALVRERAGAGSVDLRTAYLGHAAPSLPQVLGALEAGRRVTVLPLLLTAAYHSKTDIPRLLARTRPRSGGTVGYGGTFGYGGTLGPHPLLLRALERRLAETSPDALADRAGTAVVLAAAGSSDPEANATITRLAARWQAASGWHSVMPAYASAASPTPAQAVAALRISGARRVVVATYLLAPGFFADRIRSEALDAGAVAVAPVLGAAPEVADIALARYATAQSAHRRAA
jgi:sirohydrochlorin ferrochelatase